MSSGNLEKLRNWIVLNGGFVSPNIKVVTSKIGNRIERSIYAIDTITENSELVRIPKVCRINGEFIYEIPGIEKWINIDEEELIKNNFYIKIIINLIYQKSLGKKSFFYPYIKYLPRNIDFEEHPIYNYSDDLIKEWNKCSETFAVDLKNLMSKLKIVSNFIENCMDKYPIIDLSKFGEEQDILGTLIKWGFMIFLTRAWDKYGCVPFSDFFNHKSTNQAICCNNPDNVRNGVSSIKIKQNYETGDEIYINYSHYDNKILYQTYGFYEKEPIKYIKFKVSFTPTSPLSCYIDQILKLENIDRNKILLTSRAPSGLLIKYLRIISLSIYDIPKINGIVKIGDKLISASNEIVAYKNLLKLINDLKQNEYTVERFNDCQMLLETSNNIVTKNLAQIITSEYEVIKNCIIWVHANWMAKLETPILNDIINFISGLDIE